MPIFGGHATKVVESTKKIATNASAIATTLHTGMKAGVVGQGVAIAMNAFAAKNTVMRYFLVQDAD